jgi:hypothetical protein
MAEVYRARQRDDRERILAIKCMRPQLAREARFVDMFIREGKLAILLKHPSIVETFDVGRAEGRYFIAMEYIGGKDLTQVLRRCQEANQRIPVPHAIFIAARIAEGPAPRAQPGRRRRRQLNIVNRDVSPSNVRLSYAGGVKMLDFGIAQALMKFTSEIGVLKGKFSYMSPEQIRGMPVDARTDIFSAGIILHEMLTTEKLFRGDTEFALMEKVRKAEVPPPSKFNRRVPPELDAVCARALARDVADRYQTGRRVRRRSQPAPHLVPLRPARDPRALARPLPHRLRQGGGRHARLPELGAGRRARGQGRDAADLGDAGGAEPGARSDAVDAVRRGGAKRLLGQDPLEVLQELTSGVVGFAAMRAPWSSFAERSIAGEPLSRAEAQTVLDCPDDELLALIDAGFTVRRRFHGRKVRLHVLANAKSGACPEDCKFCSQSSAYETPAEVYPAAVGRADRRGRAPGEAGAGVEILHRHRHARPLTPRPRRDLRGGRAHQGRDRHHRLHLAGQLDRREGGAAQAGRRRSLQPQPRDQRALLPRGGDQPRLRRPVSTVRIAKQAGPRGLLRRHHRHGRARRGRRGSRPGLARARRRELPGELPRPRPGTPFAALARPTPQRCLKTLALFRFLLPRADLRVAGGREVNLRWMQPMALYLVNSIFTSGYLTTPGATPSADHQMIRDLGFEIEEVAPPMVHDDGTHQQGLHADG